jgi:hypothetical protein
VALTFPRHLNLQLVCGPPKRSLSKVLDIWPELPIYIRDTGTSYPTSETRDNVAAALRLNHRVAGIYLPKTPDWAWEIFGPLMQQQFPALTHLWLGSHLKDEFSHSFLGGSAPCLRALSLTGISFPTLPALLSSATNLVHLSYINVPRSGYISPQAMVTGLSALTRLESLSFASQLPGDLAIRIPPRHIRTLLPALTYLCFHGVPEYMESLVCQIDAPLLESLHVSLFPQEGLETSELAKFVRRADKLSSADRAEVISELTALPSRFHRNHRRLI